VSPGVPLHVQGLTLSAGGRTLVKALDFEAHPGERWCVIGRNAAGKSTLLRALAGLGVPGQQGRISLGGDAQVLADPARAAGLRAWLAQAASDRFELTVAELLALRGVTKAGFGLGDDTKRIQHKLGVEPADVLELNTVFRQRGYRKDMGVKGAVAVLFNQRFIKSKKAATSNWANARLTEAQLIYAANDAYAAIRVFDALGGL